MKANAISYLIQLEKKGKVTRADGYQGILNAIASDVRSKHRKRLERQNEMQSMQEARAYLAERKKYFEEQIGSYHSYVEAAMNTMQRGKGYADGSAHFKALTDNRIQEEAFCDSFYKAIFPLARPAEVGQKPQVWFLQI